MDRTLQTRWWRRRGRAALAAGGLAVAVGIAAAGPAAAGDGKDTFEGSCDFPVTVTFDPPLASSARRTHATADGVGRCSGTWITGTGKRRTLDQARVVYHAESDGEQSCAASQGAAGKGFLRYRDHKLKFRFSEDRVATTAQVRLEGRRGGAFDATANSEGDPAEVVQKCASTGLRKATATITGSTDPAISG